MQVPSRPVTSPTTPPPLQRTGASRNLLGSTQTGSTDTTTRSTPSSGQQARTSDVQAQQALTSPETVQQVGPQASRIGSTTLSENASSLSDLRGGLMSSVTPSSIPDAPPLPPTGPASPSGPRPVRDVSNIVRPDHVINTHIIQNAQVTPEVRQMKAQLRDVDLQIGQLNSRMTAFADTINEMQGLPRPLTREQSDTLKEARAGLKVAEHQLTSALRTHNTLQGQIAAATSAPHGDGHGHVRTTWENTKAAYIENESTQSSFNMGVAIEFRQRVMDTMVSQAAAELAATGSPLEAAPQTTSKAVGSTAQTSDRDINVTVRNAPIGSDTKLVQTVNDRFRAMFGQDSGTFFDTNLYNEGLMPDMADIRAGRPVDVWRSPEASRVNDQQQDLVAMVKQRRFFASSEEWATHTTAMTSAMRTAGASDEQIAAVTKQCQDADKFVVDAEKAVNDRVEVLREKFPQSSRPELELMASNELYLERVKVADQMMRDAGGDEGKIALARGQMGLAHYFANEAGMSEGVLRDVVINGQELPGINKERAQQGLEPLPLMRLSKPQLMQSFNENLGDTLKEFNHHGGSVGEASFHASKYMGRLARGFQQLTQGMTDPSLAPLKALADKLIKAEGLGLLSLRKNERLGELATKYGVRFDASNPEASKAAIATRILAEAGLGDITSVAQLRTVMKEFGQQVNALMRSQA